VLWTTVYLNAALKQLKAQSYPVREEDTARLSPFVRKHLGVHGTYSFALPDLEPGAIRELRDPDAPDEEEDWPGKPGPTGDPAASLRAHPGGEMAGMRTG
jgi:hypothetical protein